MLQHFPLDNQNKIQEITFEILNSIKAVSFNFVVFERFIQEQVNTHTHTHTHIALVHVSDGSVSSVRKWPGSETTERDKLQKTKMIFILTKVQQK
jgi:hypothetical protein